MAYWFKSKYSACFWSLATVLITGTALLAQGVTGVISGTITDQTKAPVVGATVTITNADTGVKVYSGSTNDSGIYRAPNIPVGRYNVTISAPGFKSQQVSKIELTVDQKADISATLDVGQVSQTVNVEGTTEALLATDTSSLAGC